METAREYLKNHIMPLIEAVEAEIPDAFEWAKPIALLQLSDSYWRRNHGPNDGEMNGYKKAVNKDIKQTEKKVGDKISEPQLNLIKKHINGKKKENILKFLDNRRPSELTKHQAHVLIDMIIGKSEWEFEEGIIYA